MFDHITMYRSSFLYGKGIRHYEKPGYGSQDNAFRFLAMSRGRTSISADVKYSFSNFCRENSINRKWLMEEMTRNLASLRKMLGITPEEMSNLLGISESTYKNLEIGKKEMSWDQFMSLLFIFNFNDRTSSMAEALGLFPDILKKRIKKGIISVYV